MESDELRIWLNHFEYHAQHPRCVPSGLTDLLTPEEHTLIARSIATFQLGEQSRGATLLQATERFARRHGTPALVRIMSLFIGEEQRHAALLREFMQHHGMALKGRDWTDGAFRRLRRLAGFELYLYVLISAELIGKVYYRALEAATGCQRLKVLCRVLVCDELAHVGFESQLLIALRSRRPAVQQTLLRIAHRTFIAGTAAVVWVAHRTVLRRVGHSAHSFLRTCLAQYAFYLEPPKTSLAPGSAG
ncbi:MAG TPA: hypothetical protein VKQ31_03700 [Steroidobacteraceae bacterium]|nr:hypothetical protein [Steroidobacteraceae bacterium]